MARWSSTLLLVILGLLAAGLLFGQVRWIPALADNELRENPSAGGAIVLFSIVGIALAVCGELALLAIARLVLMVRRDRIFDRRAFRWVDVITAASAAASAIVLAVLIIIEATDGDGPGELPPGIGAIMVGIVLALAALALLMAVMKALLRKALELDAELREVV